MARGPSKCKLKRHLVCRGCGGDWEYTGTAIQTQCPHCGKAKDARDRRDRNQGPTADGRKEALKTWYADPDNRQSRTKRGYDLLRKRVFFKIAQSNHPSCVRCGCDDIRLLEVNHKDGGGRSDYQGGKKTSSLYWDIALGRRMTDDLEILCRPCNAVHYLEARYGSLPFTVVWDRPVPTGEEESS